MGILFLHLSVYLRWIFLLYSLLLDYMSFHLDDISAIPGKPWVYFFYDKKETILYIGKAKNLQKRISQYFSAWSVWKQDMLSKAVKVDFVTVMTESEALYLEDNLIKKHKPAYNALLKWDNSYAYIKITKGDYPLIYLTRFRINDGSTYVWPKHYTRDLIKLMHFLRQLFQYRWCSQSIFSKWVVCSDYHFGMCKWWCVYAKMGWTPEKTQDALAKQGNALFKPAATPEEAIIENKNMCKLLVDFFAGRTKTVEQVIMEKIQTAITQQHFEYAAQLRDILAGISKSVERQHVVLQTDITGKMMKIVTVQWRHVVVVVNIYEWKMIDLIRLKYRTEDMTSEEIISDFIAEYGESVVENRDNNVVFCCSRSLKNMGKKVRKEIDWLFDWFVTSYIESSIFGKENIMSDLLVWLQQRYALPVFPYAIECTDISHLSGSWRSGSLVAMKEWIVNKKWYRKYKITGTFDNADATVVKGSDDYAALKELIIRRFETVDVSKDTLPEVFIVDWWKGQLGIIKSLYEEYDWFKAVFSCVHFCSLWKGDARKRKWKMEWAKEELYWYDKDWKVISKQLVYDDVDRLLVTLRDEAHRFANAYRRKQMWKEFK